MARKLIYEFFFNQNRPLMKKTSFLLIPALLLTFSVAGQGTHSKSAGSSTPSSGSPSVNQGASYSAGQVSQRSAPAASVPHVTLSPQSAPSARPVSVGSRTYPGKTVTRSKTDGPRINIETLPVSREGISSGSVQQTGNPDILRKDALDTSQVLTRKDAVVTFYAGDGLVCDLSAKGYFGVLVAGYEDLEKCKRDLKKYEVQFRERGYICEDWTVASTANQKQMPYQLIIGYYLSKTDVYRLWLEVQSYFPYCRIVKYA